MQYTETVFFSPLCTSAATDLPLCFNVFCCMDAALQRLSGELMGFFVLIQPRQNRY